MEEEIWKEIPGYEGFYEVSNLGRVKSMDRVVKHPRGGPKLIKGSIRKNGKHKHGYPQVILSKYSIRKIFQIHQLVAITFLNHIRNGYELVVDHIDNDPSNNRLNNLQVITQRENSNKNKSKKTDFDGVSKKGKNFQSRVEFNGKRVQLGTFTTAEEASLYYQNAVKAIESGSDIVTAKKINSSKHKGVHWCKTHSKWLCNYKRKYLGSFHTEEEAYKRVQLEIKNITFAIN